MSLKEKIARATNAGSLAWDEEGSERAVDRVTALGLAQMRVVGEGDEAHSVLRESDYLASCLWRLKYGGDRSQSNYSHAFNGVCRRVHGWHKRRAPSYTLRAVISIAIEEWRVETCPDCKGRRFKGGVYEMRPGGESKARLCLTCSGMGILQRTDKQRAEAVMNLLRIAEMKRIGRSVRLIAMKGMCLVVSARPEHIPDLTRVWEHNWGTKYQETLDVIVGLDARLSGRIRRKLDDSEAA